MLENIKIILGITDDKHDTLIKLYISKVTTAVLGYCNITELNEVLENFVEDKVVNIMKPKVTGGTQNTGEVKAVTRGDTKIEYNVGQTQTETSTDTKLTSDEKKYLNLFRKLKVF